MKNTALAVKKYFNGLDYTKGLYIDHEIIALYEPILVYNDENGEELDEPRPAGLFQVWDMFEQYHIECDTEEEAIKEFKKIVKKYKTLFKNAAKDAEKVLELKVKDFISSWNDEVEVNFKNQLAACKGIKDHFHIIKRYIESNVKDYIKNDVIYWDGKYTWDQFLNCNGVSAFIYNQI